MNQQRSRRFRTARESSEKAESEKKTVDELIAKGQLQEADLPEKKSHFDSNCITPGTPFMENLANSLRYYVASRLNSDPSWKNVKIIISDASVPGEGEHKIMDFIRGQRTHPDHDPNTKHVLYGLDADLIMLALATHEPYFKVLREDVFFNESGKFTCHICKQPGHKADQCTGQARVKQGEFDEKAPKEQVEKPFVFLHVNVLREYLDAELRHESVSFQFDLERAIDDWVFLCFFVGNDFLPHLPSLEIREGALDDLIDIWKRNLDIMGGYLTDGGVVNLERAQVIMSELGKKEELTFQKRREKEERFAKNNKRRKLQQQARDNQHSSYDAPPEVSQAVNSNIHSANLSAAQMLKAEIGLAKDSPSETTQSDNGSNLEEEEEEVMMSSVAPVKRKAEEMIKSEPPKPVDVDDDEPYDEVKLWESGFKERYYRSKFGVELNDYEFRQQVVRSYVEGLSWVLEYYYLGCPSWKWFYPFHFAPFASDFLDIQHLDIKFDLGTPFKPYEQLMGVLPAASKSHLPEAFHELMTDQDSEIIDFYPIDFEVDLNGKRQAWQGVALLPFIEEGRLLNAVEKVYPKLSDSEEARNTRGCEVLFVGQENPLYESLCALYSTRDLTQKMILDTRLSGCMAGEVAPDPNCVPHTTFASPLVDQGLLDIPSDKSISVYYFLPRLPKHGDPRIGCLLPGVKLPQRVLGPADYDYVRSGGNQRGRGRGRGRGGYGQQNWSQHYNNNGSYGQQQNSYNDYGGGGNGGYDGYNNHYDSYDSYGGRGRGGRGGSRGGGGRGRGGRGGYRGGYNNHQGGYNNDYHESRDYNQDYNSGNRGYRNNNNSYHDSYDNNRSEGGYRSQQYDSRPPRQHNDRYQSGGGDQGWYPVVNRGRGNSRGSYNNQPRRW
ncbi:5'-3' exoribonuclease 2, variant 2 [Basidiobolus ranarum]